MKELRSQESPQATDALYSLACGPHVRVKMFSGCIVNGVRFHTRDREKRRKTQNSGLVVEGDHEDEMHDFYGVLVNVIELNYIFDYRVVLFKCEWFETNPKKPVIRRDYNFICIDVSNKWYENDPFILATQAQQVFYVNDTKFGKNWRVVQRVQYSHLRDIQRE